jgi:Ni/Fe-hydrogenase subunit HybB-like protein
MSAQAKDTTTRRRLTTAKENEMASSHAHPAPAPLGGKLLTPWTVFLGLLSLVGVYFIVKRLIFGIGAVANINDGYPWGIWMVWDLVIGAALSCGGFAMALVVYIFNKGQYHPLVRPALLASLFGYTLAATSLFFDLGRYWNFWHVFWPGYAQVNSVIFELAVCMTAYILVLWIEFTPTIAEGFGMHGLRKKLEKWLFFFIGLGVLLPAMHQSSLGSMLVIFGEQIHPLWQTQILPMLFLISCLSMGFSMVVFEASVSSVGFRRPLEMDILCGVGQILKWFLLAYLVARFGDLIWRGVLGYAFEPTLRAVMFWIENILVVIPLALLWTEASRRTPQKLFIAAVAMLFQGVIYRLNAYYTAYQTGDGWNYFPSLPEIMVTVGFISMEVLAFIIVVRYLPVLPAQETAPTPAAAS